MPHASAPDLTAPPSGLTGVMLRPVRGRHTFEGCVEQLAMAIRLGVYAPGEMLPPEREISARLTVSRATVREAIAALRAAGMVETVRGRGGGTMISATPPDPSAGAMAEVIKRRTELADSLDYRRIVEPGACHLAASRTLTRGEKDQLADAAAQVIAAPDRSSHRQADSRLHLTIATLSKSPLVIDAVSAVQTDLHLMLTAIPVLPANIDHSHRQHRAVVEAITRGDAATARRAMESHCDDTAALLRGLLGLDQAGSD